MKTCLTVVQSWPVKTQPEKPLSIIEALSAGFDAVIRMPQVLAVPIVLDLFLWLGPRLSAYPLLHRSVTLMSDLSTALDAASRASLEQILPTLDELARQFNLFVWLSPFPLGAPSLMAGISSDKQPWPVSQVWQVNDALLYLGLFVLFSLMGLGLNALYWSQVARATLGQLPGGRNWLAHAGRIWLGLLELTLFLIFVSILFGAPLVMVMAVAAFISPWLVQLAALMGFSILLWMFLYLVFTLHGIALRDGSFLEAVQLSLTLMRFQFLPAAGLLLVGTLIYLGLGAVWALPDGDSWLRAAAIAGNAFVASGVLCATAVFYTDRTSRMIKAAGGK